MTPHGEPGPDPAERCRTVLAASPLLEVTAHGSPSLVGAHASDPDGRPLLLVPDVAPAASAVAGSRAAVPARVRAAQLRPLQVVDRVRARVELHGSLDVVPVGERGAAMLRLADLGRMPPGAAHLAGAPAPEVPDGHALLRIDPHHVTLDGAPVDLDAYAAAVPDPFAGRESTLLRRLLGDRPQAVAGLATLLDPAVVAEATEIAPSGLDRRGVTILVATPAWSREIRLAFAAPADTPAALEGALGVLLASAGRPRSRWT
ncbi:MAG TPA: hypothetical protein VM367_18835 [Pseudonocardia sp.]|nr:hypothetical protein [Pseudonocardia sp.]